MLEQPQKATAGQLWENQKKSLLTSNGLNSEFLSPASQSTQHYLLVWKEMPVI